MTLWRMVAASMRYSWRVSASVALGVATATAVIVGALLVGDSMRGSLQELTVQRLGKTVSAVIPGSFFPIDGIVPDDVEAVPLIYFDRGVVESRGENDDVRRAGSVQIIAADESFWQLDNSGIVPRKIPSGETVVLNASAAAELGVEVGDQVTVRLPVEQAVPADSPLGRREIQSEGLPRMEVVDIIADQGLGRFAIAASQAAPRNVYVGREIVAEALEREAQANLLLFDQPVEDDQLQVDLEHLGLQLTRVRKEFQPETEDSEADSAQPAPTVIFDYYSLSSDRLLLPELVVEEAKKELGAENVVPVMTYLANAIERLDENGDLVASVPYSTISAIDSSPSLPLDYELPEGESTAQRIPLVLNSWAADQLDADVGTELRVAYFEPEVENGNEVERYFNAIVTQIVPVTEPASPYRRSREARFDEPPTVYNDPDLTPTVPGVTDQDSISDWDLPFRLEREISREDDEYWNHYRLTPKAFLPLDEGQRLFGSRFGQTTGLRIAVDAAPDTEALAQQLRAALADDLETLGWAVVPIRQQQLAASQGTTPFDGLFLALSFFVILAAVMLIAMLFRLGLIQRMSQFGTLLAVGWPPKRVALVARREGWLVAGVGVLLGIAGGVLYAWAVLAALRTWWVGAVTVPFLTFHWTLQSLVIGAVAGWLVAAITLAVTTRWLTRVDAQTLLSQRDTDTAASRSGGGRRLRWTAYATGLVAVGVALWGATQGGQAAAGGFVGGGMLLLFTALMLIYGRLRRPRLITSQATLARYSLISLAARNASRHPLRSTMTIGLMATAAFLIIAIAAFRLQPSEQGTGGFDLIGQSAQPLYRDLRQETVQADLLGPDAELLSSATVAPMRMRLGQDASCNNLYRATSPTVLGVPQTFAELFRENGNGEQGDQLEGFQWAAVGETGDGESPWSLLQRPGAGTAEDPIPVVLDQNTAMWSLQMTEGIGQTRAFEFEPGKPVTFEVVGLLSNSVLQGRLLIGNDNFERLFEDVSGFQFFLLASGQTPPEELTTVLESRLGDVGMDISDAREVLSGLLAVQNTYLRTFQSLGALGLLLGTIGLAVAQLRSVLERRKELAVMRAIGFTRQRLARTVLSETAWLLMMGIGCGAACAVLAVLPHALLQGLTPPIVEPLLIVLGIILFGMLAGLLAVRRVTRMPLLDSLRGE